METLDPIEREDDLENALNRGALWAVSYGDMMSYLMIFFLVLFAMNVRKTPGLSPTSSKALESSLVDIQKVFGGKINPDQLERIQRIKDEDALIFKLKESEEIQKLGSFVQIQSNEDFVRLVLPEAISFDSGRANLKETIKPALAAIVELTKNLSSNIIVEGHTDSVPIHSAEYKNNFFLSSARAYAVMDYLTQRGIDEKRLSGLGYGENRPAADNGTEEGRAKNRRVEIVLVKSR